MESLSDSDQDSGAWSDDSGIQADMPPGIATTGTVDGGDLLNYSSVCGKEGKYSDIKRHIEANHISGAIHTCSLCGTVKKKQCNGYGGECSYKEVEECQKNPVQECKSNPVKK